MEICLLDVRGQKVSNIFSGVASGSTILKKSLKKLAHGTYFIFYVVGNNNGFEKIVLLN